MHSVLVIWSEYLLQQHKDPLNACLYRGREESRRELEQMSHDVVNLR